MELANIYLPKALPLTEPPVEKKILCLGTCGAEEDFFALKETLEKNRTNFRIAAKSLSKEGFKEHCSLVFKKKKDELRIQDYEKAKLKQIRKRHQKEFEKLYVEIGPAYASMYIFSKTLMKAVEFNEEFEDKIQELNRNEQS